MKQAAFLTVACFLCISHDRASAQEQVLKPVNHRYQKPTKSETPDFRRHVVPLLGKLGCNGRACHGSFQGRGGFRLSLFGYDFKADHEQLSERLDTDDPADSLIIEKPTLQSPHEGGRRMAADSWERRLLQRWVEKGARPVRPRDADLVRLVVTPREIQFASPSDRAQLTCVAVWSDGTREDVTPICRFNTNDDTIADVSNKGLVTAGTSGDTHVVISYDKAVVPIPVIRPTSDRHGRRYPQIATRTKVDKLVVDKLRKLGIVPSDVCTDAEFLRRVSLDLTGTLPTPAEVEEFLADSDPQKRSQKVDELFKRPGYVAWWTTKLCDYTGNSNDALNNVVPVQGQASRDWFNWIAKRVEQNTPYDELVRGIVVATSREDGETFEEYCTEMSAMYRRDSDAPSFADRETMPHYWARRTFRRPEERAIGFAYTFLGTRIQCAQCHKHPFDQWTQDDFKQFQNVFTRTAFGRSPKSRKEYDQMMASLDTGKLRGGELRRKIGQLLRAGETVPFQEVYATPPARMPNFNRIKNEKARRRAMAAAKNRRRRNGAAAKGKLLGGDELNLNEFADPREPLMDWLRTNPRFARAFVNRVWAAYFNRGIVDPPDDMSLANPPVNAALLDHLANGFVDSGFDIQWVHREIINSDTYQRSWRPNATNARDERNFSRAVPRRLPAEVAVDAIAQATSGEARYTAFTKSNAGRAIAIPGTGRRLRNQPQLYALTIFGRSIRESNCDCDRSAETSLLQTVYLRNDSQLLTMVDQRDGWLHEIAKKAGLPFQPKVQFNPRNARQRRNLQNQLRQLQGQIKRLQSQKGKKNQKQLQQARKRAARVREQLYGKRTDPKPDGDSPTAANVDKALLVRQAYLRTLSRLPDQQEQEIAIAHLSDASNVVNGARDLLWALLNTKEFIVNH